MRRRVIAVWLVCFAAFAATTGADSIGGSGPAPSESGYLGAAQSLAEQGSIDKEAPGIGFPALIAPAYAAGGEHGVELFLAALAALAVALGYALARAVVPDPWAIGAALACGLSPPLLAYGTWVGPELAAGAALAGAALLALRIEARPRRRYGIGCFALLGLLPWLGPKFVLAGLVVGCFAIARLRRGRRPLLAIASTEIAFFSVAFYVGLNEGIYDRPAPPGAVTGAGTAVEYLERAYRFVALFIDREFGLLRWAPVFALAFLGLWLLARGKREQLAAVIPEHQRAESAAGLCACAIGAQLVTAALLAPAIFGLWFSARDLLAALPLAVALVAWGLRHTPRAGALLALVGGVGSAWLYIDARTGASGLVSPLPDAPWGPLVKLFPSFGGGTYPYVLAAAIGVAILLLGLWEWRRTRVSGLARALG